MDLVPSSYNALASHLFAVIFRWCLLQPLNPRRILPVGCDSGGWSSRCFALGAQAQAFALAGHSAHGGIDTDELLRPYPVSVKADGHERTERNTQLAEDTIADEMLGWGPRWTHSQLKQHMASKLGEVSVNACLTTSC